MPKAALPPSEEPAPAAKSVEDINIKMSWKSFETAFEKEALEEREAYQEASLEKRRGTGSFGRLTSKVEKAIKNRR